MNLDNDEVFKKKLKEVESTWEDFEHFLEFFGSKCENPMPENMDLRKTYILQESVKIKISELDMDGDTVMEALSEFCISSCL